MYDQEQFLEKKTSSMNEKLQRNAMLARGEEEVKGPASGKEELNFEEVKVERDEDSLEGLELDEPKLIYKNSKQVMDELSEFFGAPKSE